MPRFGMGWQRQKPDPRDFKFTVAPRVTANLPDTVDISAGMGEYLDQGKLGSCGPNTADEVIEFDEKAQGLPLESASRLYIYWNTRYLMGPQYIMQDSGVDNRTMLKALHQFGKCPERLCPYSDDPVAFTKQPSKACYDAAEPIDNYAAVAQTRADMVGTLTLRHPFIFGFDCFAQIESEEAATTGIVRNPAPGEKPIGGHDVSMVGYDVNGFGKIGGPAYKFRNHWTVNGKPWGDGGYGYISASYAEDSNLAGDFWVVNAIPSSVTPSPTPPAPPSPGPKPNPCKICARATIRAYQAAFQELRDGGFVDFLNKFCAQILGGCKPPGEKRGDDSPAGCLGGIFNCWN